MRSRRSKRIYFSEKRKNLCLIPFPAAKPNDFFIDRWRAFAASAGAGAGGGSAGRRAPRDAAAQPVREPRYGRRPPASGGQPPEERDWVPAGGGGTARDKGGAGGGGGEARGEEGGRGERGTEESGDGKANMKKEAPNRRAVSGAGGGRSGAGRGGRAGARGRAGPPGGQWGARGGGGRRCRAGRGGGAGRGCEARPHGAGRQPASRAAEFAAPPAAPGAALSPAGLPQPRVSPSVRPSSLPPFLLLLLPAPRNWLRPPPPRGCRRPARSRDAERCAELRGAGLASRPLFAAPRGWGGGAGSEVGPSWAGAAVGRPRASSRVFPWVFSRAPSWRAAAGPAGARRRRYVSLRRALGAVWSSGLAVPLILLICFYFPIILSAGGSALPSRWTAEIFIYLFTLNDVAPSRLSRSVSGCDVKGLSLRSVHGSPLPS